MTEVTTLTPPRTMMELFDSIPEGTLVQLINNQIVISPAPSVTHQKVLGKIYKRLDDFIEENNLGDVMLAPCDVYLDNENAYQPDIVFIATKNADKITDKGVNGAPDIIIEVLSISNKSYDQNAKKEIYENAGVKEYFTVDPYEKGVTHYVLVNDKFHELEPTTGIIQSTILGAEFKF